MSEQGDIGDVTSGVATPQPLEVPLRAEEIVDEEAGYGVIANHLRAGEVVLMGDTHYQTRQQELFAEYVQRLISEGVQFTVAVELPAFLNSFQHETTEKLMARTQGLYGNAGREFDMEYGRRVATAIDLARQNGLPFVCIDNDAYFTGKNTPPMSQDEWMASQLKQTRSKGSAVLTLVGAHHAQATAIPRHVDALAVKIGVDTGVQRVQKPGSFDYQIRVGAKTTG